MPHGIVLQTQADAPAGRLADWAARRQITLQVVRTDLGEPYPDPRDPDFVVALGSGATAAGGGPDWVEEEIEWLRAADAAALPILGICFGAQALAAALGGCVRRLERPEVGWVTVKTLDADRLPSGPWLAWHEDSFTLPPLAYELASNAFGVQAFCHCRHLAVQFHPEVTPVIVSEWADDDHGDLERAGSTREALDDATRRHAGAAARAAETLFDGFAARAGLVAVASRV
ncbi:gamma-glutamyl-gamma-aminobutyrate hydrolase family protein [Solirubrobacter ginsenosidimutans]|uniref:Gamma-glutamyl-gamma-aminobutyrate hydrolase family protein n=1 Tax=Solirubrobacter ginsenosidimutans TaxID=490573 RepID=A0A9X3MQE8_9ACTN|nr:gamma-glutamyl-gamma-aminobutyrate hydrolase family protein [Solirubrobacter ginsenosidimutans]MDA0160524.1 gamma-glutamyl-gamma-aminobutyrate hydrolase family protein [Solirubrobacter ginsenosidimutans]